MLFTVRSRRISASFSAGTLWWDSESVVREQSSAIVSEKPIPQETAPTAKTSHEHHQVQTADSDSASITMSSSDVSPAMQPANSSSNVNAKANPSPPVSPLSLHTTADSYMTAGVASPRLDPIIEHVKADHGRSRVGSVSSISFSTTSTTTPTPATQGKTKAKRQSRTRELSPPAPSRFQHHVSFDNFAGGEPTAKNSISFTLNVKHTGYQRKKRSRTFMAGVDENDYSDIALSWMLEELVDDGDEIICLRVVDKDAKVVSDRNVDRKTYQEEAKRLMERIQSRNDEHRAISIVLEYAVGKVHSVFQKMIQLYEPAMLIVGTRGRSLGGLQGLMNISNSFSKWCLQYSPIPVVVVRPTEKRNKKKMKRDADPSRQDYLRILKESGLKVHETEGGSKTSIFEETLGQDFEAHAVAAALGLPTHFDPSPKPLYVEGATTSRNLRKIDSAASDGTSRSKSSISPDSNPSSPTLAPRRPKMRRESAASRDSNSLSGDEEFSEDEEGEFEAVSGHDLLENGTGVERKKKLHEMEVGEAAALAAGRKASVGSADSSGSLDKDGSEATGRKGSVESANSSASTRSLAPDSPAIESMDGAADEERDMEVEVSVIPPAEKGGRWKKRKKSMDEENVIKESLANAFIMTLTL